MFLHNFTQGPYHDRLNVADMHKLNEKKEYVKCVQVDEFRFIFHCDAYQHERNTLFQNCNLNRTNTDEDIVKYLFDQYPRKFSKFLIKLFQIKKEKLT